MDYATIVKSVTSPWFVAMWLVVVYLSWTWAGVSPDNGIKTWFTIYATVIVLMWLASRGAFHDSLETSRLEAIYRRPSLTVNGC